MDDKTEGIAPDMEVVDVHDEHLGRVKELLADGIFQVDCRMAPDLYVPSDAVKGVAVGRVTLRVSKSQASYMGWEVKPEH